MRHHSFRKVSTGTTSPVEGRETEQVPSSDALNRESKGEPKCRLIAIIRSDLADGGGGQRLRANYPVLLFRVLGWSVRVQFASSLFGIRFAKRNRNGNCRISSSSMDTLAMATRKCV